MNILGYDPSEREQYYNYLLSIGFNDAGASELIERLEKNRPDREDKAIYKRYKSSRT